MTNQPAKREWVDLEDAELIVLYRDRGIDAALETLVRRYQVRLYRVVLGIVDNQGLAEELCQRAFVKAARKLEQLRDERAFFPWLATIARTVTLDELRSRSRRNTVEAEAHQSEELDYPQERVEARQAVRAVLAKMEPDERLAILLADLEEHTMREIAVVMEVSESAAKMRVKRARERFRTLLEELT